MNLLKNNLSINNSLVDLKLKMKNLVYYAIGILVILLNACDKIPDGVVDISTVNYKVNSINAPSSYVYSADSTFTSTVSVSNTSSVAEVWLSIKSEDGKTFLEKHLTLADDGKATTNGDQKANDGVYTAKVKMSKKYSSGRYLMEFFVQDNINLTENIQKIGEQVLVYDNVQKNFPPVISNLNLASTIARGTSFTFSVKVEDPNGLNDIAMVLFKLYRPDGTVVIPSSTNPDIDYFTMVDNGDLNLGDQTASDGIYSFKNSFASTTTVGTWKFVFQAKDKSGAVSNIIEQNVGVN